MPSLSLRVVRSASTWPNVPAMVRLVEADPVMVPPPPVADVFADSDPCESDSVTVKPRRWCAAALRQAHAARSSFRLTPSPTVAVAGAAMTGSPLTRDRDGRRGSMIAESVAGIERDGVGGRGAVIVAEGGEVCIDLAERARDGEAGRGRSGDGVVAAAARRRCIRRQRPVRIRQRRREGLAAGGVAGLRQADAGDWCFSPDPRPPSWLSVRRSSAGR